MWNSLIVVARAEALKAVGRVHVPNVDARLARIGAFVGSAHEAWAAAQAYQLMRPANFSRDVLERGAASPLVVPVRGVLWSDWGTLDRVVPTLRRVGASPGWLETWEARSLRAVKSGLAGWPARGARPMVS